MNTQTLRSYKQMSDEKDVERLIQNLDAQINAFEKCIDLGLHQRRALVNHDLEDNIQINQQQEEMAVHLENLEKERLSLTRRIHQAQISGSSDSQEEQAPIRCKDLYPSMSPENAERLEELKQILKQKVEAMKKLNETNSLLIQNSRDIIQATMGIITGLASQQEREKARTYGAGGKLNQYKKNKAGFFNRKV